VTTETQSLAMPDEIAQSIIWPESYVRLEEVVLPACAWLRENLPVGRASIDGWDPMWVFSHHAEMVEITRNQDVFHNGDFPHLPTQEYVKFYEQVASSSRSFDYPSFMDVPEHPKFRASVMPHFQPASVRKHYEVLARKLAKEAVDGLMEFDGECDFVNDFARAYPLRVILGVLGVDEEQIPKVLQLTREFFGLHDPANQRPEFRGLPDGPARQYATTVTELQEWFHELRAERQVSPADDLTTIINGLKVDGEPWPDSYADSFLAGVAPAGHDTTSSTVAGGMLGLIRFPEQLELVKREPKLIPGLVEESLRYTTPAKHFMREAVTDTVVRGVEVPAGERVMMLFTSGNRDERVFKDPEVFDITRRPNPHLAFSHGPHICTGLHLARLEMRMLWEELIPRIGTVELATDHLEWERANLVSGLTALPIRFTKA
jgi:alpha-terpineol hydroxylase